MEELKEFISSNFFANICQLFSAIGTVGAVILSLLILIIQKKVKVFITTSTLEMFSPTEIRSGFNISGYSATICNKSSEKNIYLKQGLYIKMSKPDEKGNSIMMLLPIIELRSLFPHKDILGPGEDYTFFISEKHIRSIIKNNCHSTIKCYFMDKFNRKYNFKIKKKDLEKKLKYIEENNDEILSF